MDIYVVLSAITGIAFGSASIWVEGVPTKIALWASYATLIVLSLSATSYVALWPYTQVTP